MSIAYDLEFVSIWIGKDLTDFAAGIASVGLLVKNFSTKSTRHSIPTTGDTKELQLLRDEWSDGLTFWPTPPSRRSPSWVAPPDAGKDLTPSDLLRLRAVALAGTAEMVLELAEPLSEDPHGGGVAPGKASGVTPARVTTWMACGRAPAPRARRLERARAGRP